MVVVKGLEDLVHGEFRVAAAGLEGLRDLVEQQQPGRALGGDGRDPAVPHVGTELPGQVTVEIHHRDYAPARERVDNGFRRADSRPVLCWSPRWSCLYRFASGKL